MCKARVPDSILGDECLAAAPESGLKIRNPLLVETSFQSDPLVQKTLAHRKVYIENISIDLHGFKS